MYQTPEDKTATSIKWQNMTNWCVVQGTSPSQDITAPTIAKELMPPQPHHLDTVEMFALFGPSELLKILQF